MLYELDLRQLRANVPFDGNLDRQPDLIILMSTKYLVNNSITTVSFFLQLDTHRT